MYAYSMCVTGAALRVAVAEGEPWFQGWAQSERPLAWAVLCGVPVGTSPGAREQFGVLGGVGASLMTKGLL